MLYGHTDKLEIQPGWRNDHSAMSFNYHSPERTSGNILVWSGGKIVMERTVNIRKGMNTIRLGCEGLEEGDYVVSLLLDTEALSGIMKVA